MRKRLAALLLVLCGAQISAGESILEVVPLYHRPAEEIVPLLDPFLEDDERVVADGWALVIKSAPDRLEAITSLIHQLDTGPHNLEITVVRGTDLSADELNARARLQIEVPVAHPGEARGYLRGRYYSSRIDQMSGNTQHIRTLEGKPAVIESGIEIPYRDLDPYVFDPYGPSQPTFRETSTGFSVVSRLIGNGQVQLQVAPWSERASGYGDGVVETQGAQTTLTVPLGEWVEIGGETESGTTREHGTLSRFYRTDSSTRRILIKVEDLRP